MALSSLSLTVLAWGAVCVQKDKGDAPPARAHSGKELQGRKPSRGWAAPQPCPVPAPSTPHGGPVRARV